MNDELLAEIEAAIKSIASIYPTAFNLYDEPLQRLAERIANLPRIRAADETLKTCQRLRRRAETGKRIQVADVEALDAAIAKATDTKG